MKLTKWIPTNEFTADIFKARREMDRFFDSFFRSDMSEDETLFPNFWSPASDILEYENEYIVKLELPGVKKENVKISLENNVLTISGEKNQESELKEKQHCRIERSYGSFRRTFSVPTSIQSNKIDASYEDGILTIVLPKAEEAKPRAIEIKVK